MKITDVRLRAVKGESELKLKAYADVTFDECFVIHGLTKRNVCSYAIEKDARWRV